MNTKIIERHVNNIIISKIEKRVPFIQPEGHGNRKHHFPFADMVVGDSFLVSINDIYTDFKALRNTVKVNMRRFMDKNYDKHFVSHKQDDYSLRVWRVR